MRIPLTALLLLFTTLSFSQNTLWFIVMTKPAGGAYKQSYKKSSYWPSSWIEEKKASGEYVTEVTYGAGEWAVITSKGQGYYGQAINRSANFPKDWVSQKWDQNYILDHIAYGNGEWVVVMHLGSKLQSESWATRNNWEGMRDFIKSKWDEGKDITSIEYGNGAWCTVLAKNSGYSTQSYKWSESYPGDWIKKKYDENYNITDVAYGEGQWVIVMSKLANSSYETCATRRDFPSTYIKEKWDNSQRITTLQYNYQPGGSGPGTSYNSFDSYYKDGMSAYRSKNYSNAVYYFDKALAIKPYDAEVLNMRGWTKYLKGDYNGALIDADKAIKNGGGSKDYILHTRGAAYLKLNRCQEAITDFDKAISINSTNATYYSDRGQAKACLGRYSSAIKDYDLALGKNPENPSEIRTWKSVAQSKMGGGDSDSSQ